jgi:hypothetical protein
LSYHSGLIEIDIDSHSYHSSLIGIIIASNSYGSNVTKLLSLLSATLGFPPSGVDLTGNARLRAQDMGEVVLVWNIIIKHALRCVKRPSK